MLNKPALIAVLCLVVVASAYAAYYVTREGQGITGIGPEQGLGVFVVENDIRLAMGIKKTEYQVGETINITFEVRNNGSENLELFHPRDYGVFVFDVYDENHMRLGLWPGEASCLFIRTNISFGETYSENLKWDQKVYGARGGYHAHLGTFLELGKYYIQGWIGGTTYSILRTPLLEITLEKLDKLSDNLREYMKSKAGNEIVKVWIELTPADLENVEEDRVVEVLKSHADETQRPILEFLVEENAEVINTFWLGNSILANVAVNTVYELTSFQMIERVYGDFELPPVVVA